MDSPTQTLKADDSVLINDIMQPSIDSLFENSNETG